MSGCRLPRSRLVQLPWRFTWLMCLSELSCSREPSNQRPVTADQLLTRQWEFGDGVLVPGAAHAGDVSGMRIGKIDAWSWFGQR
jgi:hypothetical protein